MDKTSNSINKKNNQFMEGTKIGAATGKGNWEGYALVQQFYSLDATPLRQYYIHKNVHVALLGTVEMSCMFISMHARDFLNKCSV